MEEAKIFEGRTTKEAIEKGLEALGLSREEVEIKVLENEEKKSFFSILTPRVVRVEIISKKEAKQDKELKVQEKLNTTDFKKAILYVQDFLRDWIVKLPSSNVSYEVKEENGYVVVTIEGEDLNYLIGYRGEVLNQLQVILASIASKDSEYRVRVSLNICGYKEKREKSLEELADKLAKTVIRTKKPITLEPMTAYERKIIHSRLQNNSKVITTSIGEEPYRKIVISCKV